MSVVELRGGLTVPVTALNLALELEARGFTLRVVDNRLDISPSKALTPADRTRIRQWVQHLMAILEYRAPEVEK